MEQIGDHVARPASSWAKRNNPAPPVLSTPSLFWFAYREIQVAGAVIWSARNFFAVTPTRFDVRVRANDLAAYCFRSHRIVGACNVSLRIKKDSENRIVEQDEEDVLIVFVRCFRYASGNV